MAIDDAQREWEQRLRTPAAIAAAAAAVFTFAGSLVLTTLPAAPSIGVLQALTPALEGREDAEVNPRVAIVEWWDENVGTTILGSALTAVGLLAMGFALLYLYRATEARKSGTPRVTRYAIYLGPIVAAVLGVVIRIVQSASVDDFLAGSDRSRQAVEDALGGGTLPVLVGFQNFGMLATALAVVLVSLHAMRAGLLTRFLGILGIIVGLLFVFPFGALPLVQAVWLLALAPLFLLRWPGGTPPAWERGEAVPWPSQQELREARLRKAAGAGAGGSAPADDDAAEPAPPPKPQPSSKKRKRRR